MKPNNDDCPTPRTMARKRKDAKQKEIPNFETMMSMKLSRLKSICKKHGAESKGRAKIALISGLLPMMSDLQDLRRLSNDQAAEFCKHLNVSSYGSRVQKIENLMEVLRPVDGRIKNTMDESYLSDRDLQFCDPYSSSDQSDCEDETKTSFAQIKNANE